MRFTTNVLVKRKFTGEKSFMTVNVDEIEEVKELLPNQIQIAQWAATMMPLIVLKQQPHLIHIKIKDKETFHEVIKKLYKKCGKNIEKDSNSENLYKIKINKNTSFYETIDRIILRSEDLKIDTIVIHT